MADAKPVQRGNSYEVKKKEKKQKKEKVSIKLPNTRHLIRRQRAVAQGKANYNDFYSFLGTAIVVLIILFVLFGGINQRKFLETMKDLGNRWAYRIGHLFNPDAVTVNNDGIYIDPNSIVEGADEGFENYVEPGAETNENTEENTEGNTEGN